MDYCELQTTTNFTFLRGASHPEELVEQAALLGYSAIAITDRNSLAGIVRAYAAAKMTDSTPVRPHMHRNTVGRGLAGEAASATGDVTGELLRAPVRRELSGDSQAGDDFCRMKGVGPKLAAALHALGFTRFEQIAHLTPTEIERIDAQLGAFSGRLTRDRVVEQADYLARGDLDGFEQRFGKL